MDQNRRLSIFLRAALLLLFFWMVRGILVPIALGGLFALLLSPVLGRLEPRLGRFKNYAPFLLTAGMLVLVVIPFVFISIEAVRSINQIIARDWTSTFARVQSFLTDGIYFRGRTIHIDGGELQTLIHDVGQRAATLAAAAATGIAAMIPNLILDVFLFAVALYYLLLDGASFVKWMHRQSPFSDVETQELFESVRETVNGAILGIIATALVQGGLTFVALNIFRVPNAFLLGVSAMVLSIIPLVGTTPVTAGSAIYLFINGRFGAGVGMAIAAVVIGLSDNIVRPWVQSSQARMHPLIALLGIFGGLELFGAVGVFLGPVIAAMALWTVDTYAKFHSSLMEAPAEGESAPVKSATNSIPPSTSQ